MTQTKHLLLMSHSSVKTRGGGEATGRTFSGHVLLKTSLRQAFIGVLSTARGTFTDPGESLTIPLGHEP